MVSISKDLLAASSVPLILSVLKQGESYGYEIIRQVKEASGQKLQLADGTLYPILRKLEDKGLIESEWRIAENEKRRRYYHITQNGINQLKNEQETWNFINALLHQL